MYHIGVVIVIDTSLILGNGGEELTKVRSACLSHEGEKARRGLTKIHCMFSPHPSIFVHPFSHKMNRPIMDFKKDWKEGLFLKSPRGVKKMKFFSPSLARAFNLHLSVSGSSSCSVSSPSAQTLSKQTAGT